MGSPWGSREFGHRLNCQWRTAFDVADEDLACQIQRAAGSTFDHVAGVVGGACLDGDDFIRMCAHGCRKELEGKAPAVDEAVGVNAGEKSGQVLVVELRCRHLVEVGVLEILDEVENVSLCQVVRKSFRKEMVNHLGDAVQHGSERGCKEAHNGSSCQELLFPFGQNVGIWEVFARS